MVNNFKVDNSFFSNVFELLQLIEKSQNNSIPYLKGNFEEFISCLPSIKKFNLSYSYASNAIRYDCYLVFPNHEKSNSKICNDYSYIRIALIPAGIEISFAVNDRGDSKERLIKNCTKVLQYNFKETLLIFDPYYCFIQAKLSDSDAGAKLKEHIDWPVTSREILNIFSDPDVFCNQNIRVIYTFKKDWIFKLSDSRVIEKVNRILLGFLPLLILATFDEPISIITDYLDYRDHDLLFSLGSCSDVTGINEMELQKWVNAIDRKGQAILQGPPGTGKTFIAQQLAQYFTQGRDGFIELVQFHPSYSYEDFIQGIRPKTENGQLTYSLVPGRFLEFCKKAESYEDTCVLIIDEINRANLSNVFGELMYLLEYRDEEIILAGSNEPFSIPDNVRIIGTMNTADRSIALVDHALRRRFAFIKIFPNYEVLKNYHEETGTPFPIENLIPVLQQLNETIDDPNYQIGISFFMISDLQKHIEEIWTMEIEPYLEEYFYDQPEKVEEFRWNKVQDRILQS